MPATKKQRGVSSAIEQVQAPRTSGLTDDALLVFKREKSPQAWFDRTDELLDIRNLQDDWDGMGAKAPSTALVDSAFRLVQILRTYDPDEDIFWRLPPSRVVPGRTGTVIFEWQIGNGYYEIEVTAPGQGEVTTMSAGEPAGAFELAW